MGINISEAAKTILQHKSDFSTSPTLDYHRQNNAEICTRHFSVFLHPRNSLLPRSQRQCTPDWTFESAGQQRLLGQPNSYDSSHHRRPLFHFGWPRHSSHQLLAPARSNYLLAQVSGKQAHREWIVGVLEWTWSKDQSERDFCCRRRIGTGSVAMLETSWDKI